MGSYTDMSTEPESVLCVYALIPVLFVVWKNFSALVILRGQSPEILFENGLIITVMTV